eukprot:UN31691
MLKTNPNPYLFNGCINHPFSVSNPPVILSIFASVLSNCSIFPSGTCISSNLFLMSNFSCLLSSFTFCACCNWSTPRSFVTFNFDKIGYIVDVAKANVALRGCLNFDVIRATIYANANSGPQNKFACTRIRCIATQNKVRVPKYANIIPIGYRSIELFVDIIKLCRILTFFCHYFDQN